MFRRTVLIVLTFLLPGALTPCGPWYDDAHRGLQDPLREVSLEQFCYALFHADETLTARRSRGETAVQAAEAAEAAGDWASAGRHWTAAFAELQGYGDAWLVARCEDRADLDGSGASAEEVARYCAAVDGDDAMALHRLCTGNGPLADNAAYAQARLALANGDRVGAARILDAFAAGWPGSEKTDVAAYLAARVALFAWRDTGEEADAETARRAFTVYLERFPGGRHRADALGWIAHLRWVAAPGDAEATAIYLKLFLNPDLHGLFAPTVGSLHLVFQRMGDEPSAEVLADPRTAAAFLFDRVRETRWDDISAHPGLIAAARQARAVLPDLAASKLPPSVLNGLAVACLVAGDPTSAASLANAVLQRAPDSTALYLQARILAEGGKPEEAEFCWERLLRHEPADTRLADLGMRIGAAFEERGDQMAALRCYLSVDAEMDAVIVADGEIAVDDLARFVVGRERLVPQVPGEREAVDRLPWLRDILAARLARVGRYAEALPLAAPERRAAIAELAGLEQAVVKADAVARPAAEYALAAFWYRRGRMAVHVGRHWHQCFGDSLVAALDGGDPVDHAREANLLAMTTYQRARPLFQAIADRYPDSPEAPKALYSAALCDYWLCGSTYLGQSAYWQARAERDGLWRRGDDAIRELMRRHPRHPLAISEWAAKVGGGG